MIPQSMKRRFESFVLRVPRPERSHLRRVVALSYHSIHPTNGFRTVTPDRFEWHIRWLKENCELVPFGRIPELAARATTHRPMVAITFDDGYRDNFTHALPTLIAHSVPATFFVTTGLAEGDPQVIQRFASLWETPRDDIQGLTWSQILEMRAAGMDIGAHTFAHPNLGTTNDARTVEELRISKESLEDRLQEPVRSFAYPFGNPRLHFSPRTMDIAAAVGFELAGAVQFRGIRADDSPLSIPRFPITNDSLEVLQAKIFGGLDFIGGLRERLPMWFVHMSSTESARRLAG